jgi:SprT protein
MPSDIHSKASHTELLRALMPETERRTLSLLDQARQHYRAAIPAPQVRFDLRGQAAGQVRQGPGRVWQIRYNRLLLAREPHAFLAQTVPHECAHLVAFALFGRAIRPHGPEWQDVMRHFGAEPRRCHDFAVDDLRVRRLRRFDYHCVCRTHQLTSTRHRRAQAGQTYFCVACRGPLVPGAKGQDDPGAPTSNAASGRTAQGT